MQKKILKSWYRISVLLLLIMFNSSAFAIDSNHGMDGFKDNHINPSKNAVSHSNMGNIYFNEKNYISAIAEYEIAYNLAYDTQAAGTYLYNLARCYYSLGYFSHAKKVIQGAISKDCMNLTYYDLLAGCIVRENNPFIELRKYLIKTNNPYNKVIAGLIYFKLGKKTEAKNIFDEFITNNPDMLISNDIKTYMKKI